MGGGGGVWIFSGTAQWEIEFKFSTPPPLPSILENMYVTPKIFEVELSNWHQLLVYFVRLFDMRLV